MSTPDRPRVLRILLVDDDPLGRAVAAAILEEMGHAVELASDGAQAVDRCRQGGVDLVLMDVQMPGMDGCEAARRIRSCEARSERRLPIVALTGDASDLDRQACLAAGMDDHLAKPLRPDQAEQAIARALARQVAAAADAPQAAADAEVADVLAALGLEPLPAAAPDGEPAAPLAAEVLARLEQEFDAPPDVVLDEGALERLAELEARGALSVARIAALFCEAGEDILPALRAALAVGATAVLRREAHTLKGNARDVGAHRLAGLCQELEEQARQGEVEGADALLERVAVAWSEAQQALQAFLERRA